MPETICAPPPPYPAVIEHYDVLIRNGLVYDGSGAPPRRVEVTVNDSRIVALLPAGARADARQVLDAAGMAVAPGFINVLSWSTESLIADGLGVSYTRQGVTLEIFGEGWSMGPPTPAMKATALERQFDIKYPIEWTTLGEYLDFLVRRGITPNVASLVGATTVRIHELGEAEVTPSFRRRSWLTLRAHPVVRTTAGSRPAFRTLSQAVGSSSAWLGARRRRPRASSRSACARCDRGSPCAGGSTAA